jgi:hypothetical protein
MTLIPDRFRRPPLAPRRALRLASLCALLGLAAPAWSQATPPAGPEAAEVKDFSPAERLLLMSPQLGLVKPPATLNYRFRRSGTLDEAFEDSVRVSLQRVGAGAGAGVVCCKASAEFLSGKRRLALPEIDQAEGNPVTLYFLEHDIREMKARTQGSVTYFRKRIRMALYQGAQIRDVTVSYRGKTLPAREIRLEPYRDDPNRAKFERFTGKQYVFVLSDQVPGAVVSIRSRVPGEAGAAPLIEEELWLDGAAPSAVATALR